MRSKLLIISLFVSLCSIGQKLPITGLCLDNVLSATGGTCLATAFTNANSAYFDPAYAVTGGNWLDDFRNYGAGVVCTRPSGLSNVLFWNSLSRSSGAYVSFLGSFADASRANYDYANNLFPPMSLSGNTNQVYSTLAVGDSVYASVATHCNKIGNGYYLTAFSTYPQYVYHIVSGIITEKTMASINTTPTVTTSAATSIARWSATLGGNVTADGGSTVTARGICSATTQNPTTSPVSMGSGLGVFSQTVGGMTPGTLYYVRAYATNSSGTTYGNQISFTTSADIPTMTATYISSNVAPPLHVVSEMNITSLGGATVTDFGLCWSTTNSTPTKADTYYSSGYTANSTGAASFEVPYTNFSQCQSYYGRFYATNSAGTGYSNVIQFTYYCPTVAPTVSTDNACFVDVDNALIEGTVSADGGATVTARGFCYTTSNSDPTTADSVSGQGSGTGYFSWSPNGLPQNTNIYIRAYATNSAGTSYGTVYTINSTQLCN